MKSDFSGEYVLDRASKLSSGAAAVQRAVVRIEHREPAFRYWAKFVAEGKTVEHSFERLTDGREVAVGEPVGATTRPASRHLRRPVAIG